MLNPQIATAMDPTVVLKLEWEWTEFGSLT